MRTEGISGYWVLGTVSLPLRHVMRRLPTLLLAKNLANTELLQRGRSAQCCGVNVMLLSASCDAGTNSSLGKEFANTEL